MLRKELDIQNVRAIVHRNRQTIEEDMMNLYQIDLIEQLQSVDTYPVMLHLPITAEGFSDRDELYTRRYWTHGVDYTPVAKRLIKQLQENGWTIHDADIFYEDGELYFYLEDE